MTPDTTAQLDERQCLRLLAGASVGRLVYSVGALPAVLPFRYRLSADGCVQLSTGADSALVRAVSGALVAFEAGEVAESDGGGWSVTVLGRAEVDAAPAAAAPGTGRMSIRIRPELLRGRVLPAAPTEPSAREGRPLLP